MASRPRRVFNNVAGKRPDLGNQHFKSKMEANFARYLNFLIQYKEIHQWEYEPDTFWFHKIKTGTTSYTPDFKVWEKPDSTPYYMETKGYMSDKCKTQFNRMRIYYPEIKIRLITTREMRDIRRKIGRLISWWE